MAPLSSKEAGGISASSWKSVVIQIVQMAAVGLHQPHRHVLFHPGSVGCHTLLCNLNLNF